MPKHYDLSEESADLDTLARQVNDLVGVEKKKLQRRKLAASPDAALPKWLRNPLTRGIVFGSIVSILVMVLLFVVFITFRRALELKIKVPDIVGKNYRVVKTTLTQQGLKVKIKKIQNNDKPQGTVVAILPIAGTKVPPNSEVTITVTIKKGQPLEPLDPQDQNKDTHPSDPAPPEGEPEVHTAKLPDVIGMVDDKAKMALKNLKLGLEITITQKSDPDQSEHQVLACDPKPGTLLTAGDTVHLIVNIHTASVETPEPDHGLVSVPDYAGRSGKEAIKELEKLGFAVSDSTEKTRLQSPGYVIKTDPSAGAKLPHGSTIKVIIAGN